jgi:hypothetical protein
VQRSFPDTLLHQQKEYLMREIQRERQPRSRRSRSPVLGVGVAAVAAVALAVGLVFGVVLPRAADNPPVAQMGVTTTSAPVPTVSPSIIEAVPVALVLQKTLVATTASQGDVLHVVVSGIDTDGATSREEVWWTSGTAGKYRSAMEVNGHLLSEVAYDSNGLVQEYDAKADSIVERPEEAARSKVLAVSALDGYREEVQRLLASGLVVEDGHEQVGGRDAVRIVEEIGDGTKNVFLIDAETYAPIEWRIGERGENRVIHFDVYEKLPGTPENLRLLDLKAAHPGATVQTASAAAAGTTTTSAN